jgi:hypothetical protein
MIDINGVTIPTPSAFQVSISDVSEAERNAKGDIMIDRIATKRKLELSWAPLSSADMSTILKAVKDIFFTVTYPDPQEGAELTKTFYVGDRTAPVLTIIDGAPMWSSLKFNLIEK